MYLFTRVSNLQQFLLVQQQNGRSVGFVPTMGALHSGHLSLIAQSKAENDLTVCSIFVNPTQFNDPNDLARYPRNPVKDIEMLEGVGCDVVFLPSVHEIYPPDLDTTPQISLGQLDKVLEGEFRPGHFAGVVQVVKRLLDIVQPARLYMGQKDFQQFSIIRFMIRELHLPVQLVMGPTVREADGLAMSSRNVRLSETERSIAPAIYQSLARIKAALDTAPPPLLAEGEKQALTAAGLRPEYLEIVDAETLLPVVTTPDKSRQIIACAAAWLGNVRLIDNMILT